MNDGDDIARIEAEIGQCDLDFMAWSRRAQSLGFAATFVPVHSDGQPTLCLGAWMQFPLALSDDLSDRAVAAIIFCDWTRGEALRLGAEVE